PGQCGANVSYPDPSFTGSCGTITCLPASGSFFALGTTTVTCTSQANTSTSFTVTVNDTEAPMVTPISVATPALWPPNQDRINVACRVAALATIVPARRGRYLSSVMRMMKPTPGTATSRPMPTTSRSAVCVCAVSALVAGAAACT